MLTNLLANSTYEEFYLSSGKEVADAMVRAGIIDPPEDYSLFPGPGGSSMQNKRKKTDASQPGTSER